jgi:hypothetical protein
MTSESFCSPDVRGESAVCAYQVCLIAGTDTPDMARGTYIGKHELFGTFFDDTVPCTSGRFVFGGHSFLLFLFCPQPRLILYLAT